VTKPRHAEKMIVKTAMMPRRAGILSTMLRRSMELSGSSEERLRVTKEVICMMVFSLRKLCSINCTVSFFCDALSDVRHLILYNMSADLEISSKCRMQPDPDELRQP
jgi:hypothetical protein